MFPPKKFIGFLLLSFCLICLLFTGCAPKQASSIKSSGDPAYENTKIAIESETGETKEITVAELRKLPQKELDEASLTRSTGFEEKFKAAGPTVKDVLASMGINIQDYKGLGFVGRDNYYCLVTPEIMANRELILAIAVDGQSALPEDLSPARLCIKGEFGPYWVRMVNKIILYKEIPKKDITSVWIFKNLAQGIAPYPYEYFGSKDDAIELAQIFARFDNVSNKAFFTMKSADGFLKNEALNMVSKGYYLKVAGKDAPMNISPNYKLGMNVKYIAWFSTNADAVVFPEEMAKLIDQEEITGVKGTSLEKMLEEVRVENIGSKQFEVIDVSGDSVKVDGKDLTKGILVNKNDGTISVVWQDGTGLKPVANLMRIRSVK